MSDVLAGREPLTPGLIVGVDLSLRSTGLASAGWVERIATTGTKADTLYDRYTRLRHIRAVVLSYTANASLVVVEGPLLAGAGYGHAHDRSGLWWSVVTALLTRDQAVAVVPPSVLKKYATGKGNATKDAVLSEAVRRFPDVAITGNDQADAMWLAAMGYAAAGRPLCPMPALNMGALSGVDWPELAGAA